ncbi:hypothetical protein [Lentzea sp.]|uniref:hypothetical protein n=1 Tax=Lentzea sp. TaxID=56099 RepID=UPI002B5A72B7|nr:hypothetical protein [Lentzea sp.]HUQ57531.1 hypothetical protein [Lentzea sp.]
MAIVRRRKSASAKLTGVKDEPSWPRKAQELLTKGTVFLVALHVVLVEVRTLLSAMGLV